MSQLDDEQLQDLFAWVDEIPLSRPKKTITRDFSDGGKSKHFTILHGWVF